MIGLTEIAGGCDMGKHGNLKTQIEELEYELTQLEIENKLLRELVLCVKEFFQHQGTNEKKTGQAIGYMKEALSEIIYYEEGGYRDDD